MSELYELPDGWVWKKLDDIANFQNGYAFRSKEFNVEGNGFQIIRIGNVLDIHKNPVYIDKRKEFGKYLLTENDIVISMTGTRKKKDYLFLRIVNSNDTYLNQRVGKITSNENSYFKYLYYFLKSNCFRDKIFEYETGAVNQGNISAKDIMNSYIPYISIKEQKRIASKLDTLFEKIDKAIDLHEKNIKEADDFMGSVLNEVFEELEEKNSIIKINDIVVKTNNKNTKENVDSNYTYIDISSIDNELFKIAEPKIVIGKDAPSRAKKEVFIGDVLYATTRPNLKNIAIIEKEYENPIASTGFCILRVKNENEKKFLFYYLLTNKLFEQIELNIRGAQYPATSDKDLKNCNIPEVSLKTQQKVVKYLDKISKEIEKTKAIQKEKLQNLKDLKASILDQAFKGKL